MLATRIPLGGTNTREGISRAEVGERFGMPAFRIHVGKRLIAGADCLDQQQAGHDRDLVAHLFRFGERDVRRLSTAYDIQKTWTMNFFWAGLQLINCLHRFEKRHIRAGFERRIASANPLFETERRPRIGTRNDNEIVAPSRVGSGSNLRDVVFERDELFVIEMTALLWKGLIFNMNASDTGILEGTDRAICVQLIAVAIVGIRNHRQIDRIDDPFRILNHLAHRQ